jgi:hypothetical protein
VALFNRRILMKILKQLSTGLLGIAFLIELAGCASQSSDTLAIVAGANAQRLRTTYGDQQKLTTLIAAAEHDKEQRNILLNDLILIVDLHYYSWEKRLYDKKAGFDLGSDAVLLGLGGATALSGTTELANILGQITTGITGLKASVDSDLLQKNTIPAMVSKMRAARATQLAKMQAAMTKTDSNGHPLGPSDISKYSIQQGLIDLNSYYAAGTFVGALQDITAKAAVEKQAAEQTIQELKPSSSAIKQTPDLPGGKKP